MAFDQATRNKLQNFVSSARTLLTTEFTRQLQNDYGMDPKTCEISKLERLTHLNDTQIQTAGLLRDTLKHYQTGITSNDSKEILGRIVREQAFTVLNRLCALRMAEAREILIESIGKGYNSKGFQLYARVAGTSLGETGDTYRNYLFSLFDEFAHDLAVLFDRYSPMGRLFPRESALLELLDKINDVGLEALWAEDETIGWIYQYFNSVEERKQMRAESQAPRNSRELAVRNQFFTPRYVVEFLTDNTLGRIWYEMTRGNTGLKDQCRYLVRRPNEIFLKKGGEAPEQKDTDADLSQEELLKQPVYIEYRPIKDPREILMLDPACGSMHFGLYAFDLFEKIYEEAWDLQSTGQWQGIVNKSLGLLTETYATRNELLRDVPRLIIENNIHGIDIAPRAVQIAGLSLWLRAQRSWKEHNVKPGERPRILKSNIVCAEPMPGDKQFLKEFPESLKPKVLGRLLEIIFEKMELAGEAGSLLKIEEEIEEAVENAREEFNKEILLRKEEAGYLPGMAPKRQPTLFDFADLPDKTQFWETAEEKILDALRDYAEKTEEGDGGRRRLFVEDAAKGFAFIDICRKRFDVVLMNPPYGTPSEPSKPYLSIRYPSSWIEIYICFCERAIALSPKGLVGSLTSRTWMYLQKYDHFRNDVLVRQSLRLLADLGGGVLDNAVVETCAYILESSSRNEESCFFFDLNAFERKCRSLNVAILDTINGKLCPSTYIRKVKTFLSSENRSISYTSSFGSTASFTVGSEILNATPGLSSHDDFRFARFQWEIPVAEIKRKRWKPAVYGGQNQHFCSNHNMCINWHIDGAEMKAFIASIYGSASRGIRNESCYFKPGLAYQYTGSTFRVYILPKGMIITMAGQGMFPKQFEDSFALLALLNTKSATRALKLINPGRFFQSGYVNSLQLSSIWIDHKESLVQIGICLFGLIRELCNYDETYNGYNLSNLPFLNSSEHSHFLTLSRDIESYHQQLEDIAASLFPTLPVTITEKDNKCYLHNTDINELRQGAFHSLISMVYGRWDIRFATGERQPPELPNPFDHLPVCPPGMLQNSSGLPAEPKDVPADYPLRISWSGIIVNDEGHPEDIVARVRETIEVIWKDKSSDIEQEACEILNIRSLREYFSKPAKFFADHLKRYSKSRRQAPIYWPLSTPSGSYTLWLYYHRLNDQILYTCVLDLVEPKLKQVAETVDNLRKKTGRTSEEEKELEKYSDLELELRDFRDKLLRIAKFWKPNLNDGVQITAAPLWKLFQHKPWQKKLKQTWNKLEKGEYDWAHLAYSIWPERVIKASHKDRSYAIAHDLEEDLWDKIENGTDRQGNPKYKWVPKDLFDKELRQIIQNKMNKL